MKHIPRFGVYGGYTDMVSWLLRIYEGMFRYHLINGRGETDRDFLSLLFIENQSKFIIMEE